MSTQPNAAATKLAIIVAHTGKAGAEIVVETFLRNIDSTNFEIYILAPQGQYLLDVASELGFVTHLLQFPSFISTSIELGELRFFNPFATLYDLLLASYVAKDVREFLIKHNIDTVYTGSMMAHLLGGLACKGISSQIVCHVQDIVSDKLALGIGKPIFRQFLKYFANLVVVPSKAVAHSINTTHTQTIHLGIDTQKFDPNPNSSLRQELGLSETTPIIGVTGRVTRWKGQHIFVEAAAKLLNNGLDAHFVIVGAAVFNSKAYEDHLHNFVEQAKLNEHITFMGFRNDISNVVNGLDIVVVPSILSDPSPLTVLESMACAKPVIGSAIGGIPELIKDKSTGTLIPPNNPDALAQAIKELITNKAIREEYGIAARQRIEDNFSLSQFIQEMTNAFANPEGI